MDSEGQVQGHKKISNSTYDFGGTDLSGNDYFGTSLANLGDLDGNGTIEIAVGAEGDSDGGAASGAVWIVSVAGGGVVNTNGAPAIDPPVGD